MSTTMNRPTLVVCNILMAGDLSLLMGLRANELEWECPGGKVEDESIVEAAKREMFEETGMVLKGEPQPLGFADVQTKDGRRWFVVFLRWKEWDGIPLLREPKQCKAWRWVGPFEPSQLPLLEGCTPGTQKFFKTMYKGLVEQVAREQEARSEQERELPWDGCDIEPSPRNIAEALVMSGCYQGWVSGFATKEDVRV